jgi:hypothetical protein
VKALKAALGESNISGGARKASGGNAWRRRSNKQNFGGEKLMQSGENWRK